MHAGDTAAELVEWLGGIWGLLDRHQPVANPHLLALLRLSASLPLHPAFEAVADIRRTTSRDRVIKMLIESAYGRECVHPALPEHLLALRHDAPDVLGRAVHQLIDEARREAGRQLEDMLAAADPARDVADVTGERLAVRMVASPSVFLPLPQLGRHGALVPQGDGWVVHLHFGYPLCADPRQFGIDRYWVLGGAWHYAIQAYLERHWPPIEARLLDNRELMDRVRAAVGPPPRATNRPWTDLFRIHLVMALKSLVSRRAGADEQEYRAFAERQGLVLYCWFDEWLLRGDLRRLAVHLRTLPDALERDRRWEEMMSLPRQAPSTLNLALSSASARKAVLVIPDGWSETAAATVRAAWRLLGSLRLLRYTEWRSDARTDATPVIAVGGPEENPVVRQVIEQHGGAGLLDDQAVIALSLPDAAATRWCVAIAIAHPELASVLHAEVALRQSTSWATFDTRVSTPAQTPPITGAPSR